MKPTEVSSETEDRAVSALAAPRHWLLSSLVLLPASYVALACAWGMVLHYWSTALAYASRWVSVPMAIAELPGEGAWLGSPAVALQWSGRYPGKALLLVTAFLCTGAFAASFVRQQRWLPFAYLVRALAAVQFAVCVYFLGSSHDFPYSAQEHMREMVVTQTIGIKVIPVTLSLTYYTLNFTLTQKTLATLLIVTYFIAIAPFFFALHACVVFYGSLLFVPLCFFVLGAPLLLGLLLGLYSYCASWPAVYEHAGTRAGSRS
jgi:hypothetical protein